MKTSAKPYIAAPPGRGLRTSCATLQAFPELEQRAPALTSQIQSSPSVAMLRQLEINLWKKLAEATSLVSVPTRFSSIGVHIYNITEHQTDLGVQVSMMGAAEFPHALKHVILDRSQMQQPATAPVAHQLAHWITISQRAERERHVVFDAGCCWTTYQLGGEHSISFGTAHPFQPHLSERACPFVVPATWLPMKDVTHAGEPKGHDLEVQRLSRQAHHAPEAGCGGCSFRQDYILLQLCCKNRLGRLSCARSKSGCGFVALLAKLYASCIVSQAICQLHCTSEECWPPPHVPGGYTRLESLVQTSA
jgi:hypothetical protein